MSKKRLLIVTGLSGAGRSTVLHTLEDWDWEIVDKLPVDLLSDFVGHARSDGPFAVGIDSRTREFDPNELSKRVAEIEGVDPELLFLDCSDDEIVRRYDATRRRHPLAGDADAEAGIERERKLLAPLREVSDSIIDTTECSPAELRERLETSYGADKKPPVVQFLSFGFSDGVPRSADLVFDMRFLKNPYWEPNLRSLTGRDRDVRSYVEADPAYGETLDRIEALLEGLIPRYWAAGKNTLTVAFGCTGGRHRSVAAAEEMAGRLKGEDRTISIRHRDLVD
ncbi:RNase adapter RapZ [Sphingomicrobium clamense]|uniref:RNase adapter RapZ n=1 Tax=Sphingomicrobium clamense TaxID=2851013 RepID=A0ABS6V6I0_9SPHN|nr:RNase adapter RapZ [Sphingomicrobium sp. B8]MBW0144965.1 RNase adapter RapZ [Sphingomicrobium sp. B8]